MWLDNISTNFSISNFAKISDIATLMRCNLALFVHMPLSCDSYRHMFCHKISFLSCKLIISWGFCPSVPVHHRCMDKVSFMKFHVFTGAQIKSHVLHSMTMWRKYEHSEVQTHTHTHIHTRWSPTCFYVLYCRYLPLMNYKNCIHKCSHLTTYS